jgi:hypothetical protein
MPPNPDTFFIFCAKHLADPSCLHVCEGLDPWNAWRHPGRQSVCLFQLVGGIVILATERCDPALALKGTELKRRQRQRANLEDEGFLFVCRNEIGLVAKPLEDPRV